MSVRLLIADDQALVRAGFRMILDAEDDLEVIGEATDGLDAVEQARRLKPDVVLMDIRMPELDGIEATRRLLAEAGEHADPRAHAHHVRPQRVRLRGAARRRVRVPAQGRPAGAARGRHPRRRARRGAARAVDHPPADPGVRRRHTRRSRTPPPGLDELTARELEVFRCVARGLSNAEIAAELIVSETTVKTHVARLLMKLGLRDRVQAVVLAYESGIAVPGKT